MHKRTPRGLNGFGAFSLPEGEGAERDAPGVLAPFIRKDSQSRDACPVGFGVLAERQSYFSSGEHSVQGKAGALWGTTFPLLPPLPSPRNTPSLALALLVPRYGPVGFGAKPTRATSRSAIAIPLSPFGRRLL